MKNRNEFDNYDEVMPEGMNQVHMPIIFLLDVSSSMTSSRDYLNQAANKFLRDVKSHSVASQMVEAMIIPFNHDVQGAEHEWKQVREISEVCLNTSGGTDLSKALKFANGKLKERCNMYEEIGAEVRGPTIFLISDGYGGDISGIAEEIRKRVHDSKMMVWVLAVEGYDKHTMALLTEGNRIWEASNDDKAYSFDQFFAFASEFVKAKSVSAPGEKIAISDESNPMKRSDSVLKVPDLNDWLN